MRESEFFFFFSMSMRGKESPRWFSSRFRFRAFVFQHSSLGPQAHRSESSASWSAASAAASASKGSEGIASSAARSSVVFRLDLAFQGCRSYLLAFSLVYYTRGKGRVTLFEMSTTVEGTRAAEGERRERERERFDLFRSVLFDSAPDEGTEKRAQKNSAALFLLLLSRRWPTKRRLCPLRAAPTAP